MLSFGIRFGQGFDRSTVLKMMELVPTDFDYDFLVIGSSPGGVASAREANSAGKKVGIIRIKRYSPAEAEGFDEDLQKMAEALSLPRHSSSPSKVALIKDSFGIEGKSSSVSGKKSSVSAPNFSGTAKKILTSHKSSENFRKVRLSRLDLNNELFKRGQQCRKLMHNAIQLGDLAETAHKCGWRIVTATRPPSINWKKMTEEVMDYVMKENWLLQTALKEEGIDVIEGSPTILDDHTVSIYRENGAESRYTSDLICLALSSECVLPDDVIGAAEFGITYDDFVRMDKEPGKTLIVGGTPVGLECAGILAGCKLPVTLVSQSPILKDHDSEMAQLIVDELRGKGVTFLTETTLTVVKKTADNKLLASFVQATPGPPDDSSVKSNAVKAEQYDTVLFAVGRKVNFEDLNVSILGIEIELGSEKIMTDKYGATTVPHVYAVGDVIAGIPESFEVSELSGKLLGKRLFHDGTDIMDYFLIPEVMYTPTEYAYVGLSEDTALLRLGEQCIEVYCGEFKPLDFVIPERKGSCFAKIIVFKRNDTILGLHIFGPEAGEMIQGFATALKAGLTMTNFRAIAGVTGTKVQEIFKLKELRTFEAEDTVVL